MPASTPGWPDRLIDLGHDPHDAAPDWAEHVQGVSCDERGWVLTQVDRIWRVPFDLARGAGAHDPEVRTATIPVPGVDHLGDCDVHGGRLYVAMEGSHPAQVGVFDRDLGFVASGDLTAQGPSCPWCAVNPRDGLLYSSPFDTDHLCAYAPVHSGGAFELRHVRDIPLVGEDGASLRLERVQGGAFTDGGQLYLSSDRPDGGLHGIDVGTGRRRVHQPVPYEPDSPEDEVVEDEVVEGLAVHDFGDDRSAPGRRGTVHVLVLERRDDRTDHVWLRHYDLGYDGGDGDLRARRPRRAG